MTRRKKTKPVKIENIWIISGTQVEGPEELGRGCYLAPRSVFQIDKKYESVEKTRGGSTVEFKISEEKAAKLIEENQAVACKRDNERSPWYAVDIFGDKIDDEIQIVVDSPKKKKKAGEEDKITTPAE